jgi:hypothetical protein
MIARRARGAVAVALCGLASGMLRLARRLAPPRGRRGGDPRLLTDGSL